MKDFSNFDSKYRFVIVAAKRAKELLKGAKPRLKSKSKNPIRIAQNEVKMGLVDYEILKSKKEDVAEPEERVFLGGEVVADLEPEQEGTEKEKPGEEVESEAEEAEEEEGLDIEFSDELEPHEEAEDKGEEEG